jgi:glutamate-1-semialdehyde 2,1-aminomutase
MLQLDKTILPPLTESGTLCRDLQARAQTLIPGVSQLLSKRPDRYINGVWPTYYEKAKGAEVWDLDGNRYIDMSIGGIGANVLGYADDDVDDAVKAAIDKGSSSSLNCAEDVYLAELMCELHPWAEMVRFARGGGDAMAVAVRIARAHTGRDKVAFCGYHGWHDWYLAANVGTEDALGEHLISGLQPTGVPKALKGTAFPFGYNQLDELKKIVAEHKDVLAAIVMEPIRSAAPDKGFLEGVRQIADETGAVFIFDEVSAGFRMNTGGAHLTLGTTPDIAVFSKAMGNGYPIAAIIGKASVMDAAQSSFISSTMWTERVGPTAAIATINKFRDNNVFEHLMRIGTKVQDGWRELSEEHSLPIHVGGIPPLGHFSFDDEQKLVMKSLFIQEMLDKGFMASTSFYSMFAHTDDHVESYLDAADKVFGFIKEVLEDGSLASRLRGEPAASGFKRLA